MEGLPTYQRAVLPAHGQKMIAVTKLGIGTTNGPGSKMNGRRRKVDERISMIKKLRASASQV